MADLVAIGYPDESTGVEAMRTAEELAADLIIQPDQIAAIIRHKDGKFQVITNHHEVGGGAAWGGFWGLFFGLIFFVPVLGLAVGAGMGALMGKFAKSGIDKEFEAQVREMLKPGTSALFMVVEKVTPDKAIAALSQYGGTVLKSSLPADTEQLLQEELTEHQHAVGT
jgi:uncharacterized membrane protein